MKLAKGLVLLQAMRNEVEAKFVEMGGLMLDLLEAKEANCRELAVAVGYSRRRVSTMLAVARAIRSKLLKKKDALKLGSTRAGTVAEALNTGRIQPSQVQGLMEMPSAQLLKAVNGSDATHTVVSFTLTKEEHTALNSALVQFGAIRHAKGLRCKETALMTILVRAGAISVKAAPKLKAVA